MKAVPLFFLCVLAPAYGFPQQEIPLGTEATTPILKKIQTAPLTDLQKQQIREAIQSRQYKTAETILVNAIEANKKSAELLTLSAGVFLLDKNPLNTAIALKKAERIQPLAPAERFSLAMAYVAMSKRDWARSELDRLTAAEPANTLYSYWLARLDYDDQHF